MCGKANRKKRHVLRFGSRLIGLVLLLWAGCLRANTGWAWDEKALQRAFSETQFVEYAFLGDIQSGHIYWFGEENAERTLIREQGFPIASCGKLLIAECILQLADAGEIDLDDPMDQYWDPSYLPDNPFPQPLTVRHLLRNSAASRSRRNCHHP